MLYSALVFTNPSCSKEKHTISMTNWPIQRIHFLIWTDCRRGHNLFSHGNFLVFPYSNYSNFAVFLNCVVLQRSFFLIFYLHQKMETVPLRPAPVLDLKKLTFLISCSICRQGSLFSGVCEGKAQLLTEWLFQKMLPDTYWLTNTCKKLSRNLSSPILNHD